MKFSDVAGLEEVKEDLMTVVDFLKTLMNIKKLELRFRKVFSFTDLQEQERHCLQKAVAGEAGVKFKAVSGSDFDEKYVGSRCKQNAETF